MRTIIQGRIQGELLLDLKFAVFEMRPSAIGLSDGARRVSMVTGARLTTSVERCPIVAEKNFVLATREVGYRSLGHAIAELVDNSIQATSRHIQIFLFAGDTEPVFALLDDGRGMDIQTLRTALQFGGTDRFNDRSGLGRFGMGLPSSSMSQARRLEVYSWQRAGHVNHSYLDVDEIVAGRLREIPMTRRTNLPSWMQSKVSHTGTLVVWQRCDKISGDQIATESRRLRTQLGQIFRYFIWEGTHITVNGCRVQGVDPLYCNRRSPLSGATAYGTPLVYKIRLPHNPDKISTVRVRFSELPVAEWQGIPIQEKRRLGIVKGAGVSLVRAHREIAYGWYFLGEKRRENYDDWWRCEISFGPELDEYFHPTHTKQEIHPGAELEAALTPDLEALARTLNFRVRASFSKLRSSRQSATGKLVSTRDKYLPPLREEASSTHIQTRRKTVGRLKYSLSVRPLQEDAFYSVRRENETLELILNKDHAFFELIYAPLCQKNSPQIRAAIDCLLFALLRTEAEATSGVQRYWYNRKRKVWSNILATFLGS